MNLRADEQRAGGQRFNGKSLVEHAPDESGPWNLMRITGPASGLKQPCQIGLYACSPKEHGCRLEAGFLRIEQP